MGTDVLSSPTYQWIYGVHVTFESERWYDMRRGQGHDNVNWNRSSWIHCQASNNTPMECASSVTCVGLFSCGRCVYSWSIPLMQCWIKTACSRNVRAWNAENSSFRSARWWGSVKLLRSKSAVTHLWRSQSSSQSSHYVLSLSFAHRTAWTLRRRPSEPVGMSQHSQVQREQGVPKAMYYP